MKAVVYRKYGSPDVLHMEDVDKPIPKDGEILVRVRATTVTAGDWRMRKPNPFAARLYNGLFRSKRVTILGLELAGDVEALGPGADRFGIGDQVFAFAGFGFGGYAEYRCLPVDDLPRDARVARQPASATFEESACLPCRRVA
jgi:NADPH:quinone reductase-like Zn-dependent oxidoreductase